MKISIPEMSCGHCKASITTAISKLDSSAKLTFDMESRQVDIATDKPFSDVQTALTAVGFDSAPA